MDENKFYFNQVFGDKANNIHDPNVPMTEEFRNSGLQAEQAFTYGVDVLRNFDDERIAALGRDLWNLVGSRVVPVGMANLSPSISFWAEKIGAESMAIIIVPPDFANRLNNEFIFTLGGIVSVGSMARDYYNGLIEKEPMFKRANAHEALFLRLILHYFPEYQYNEYQKQILNDYPNCLDSLPANLLYQSIPIPESK